MCKKQAASTPLLLQTCRSSSLLLTVFPAWFIRHYLLQPSISFSSQPAISLFSGTKETLRAGRAAFRKRWALTAVCQLPPPARVPVPPSSQSTPSSDEQLIEKQWGCSSKVSPPKNKQTIIIIIHFSSLHPNPKEKHAGTVKLSSLSPRARPPREEKPFAACSGLCSIAGFDSWHCLSPGVTQRVIKRADYESKKATTFSYFNLIWSSRAPHACSIRYFLLHKFFSLQLPQHPLPSPSSTACPALGLSLRCKKERHLLLHSL